MDVRTERRLCGRRVGAIGLGCMGMSFAYTTGGWDESAAEEVVGRALDLGITVLDTADVYGPFTNERLIGRALRGRRSEAFLAGKGGLVVVPDGGGTTRIVRNGRPGHLRRAVRASLRRLGTDHLDLYQLHRVDDRVPVEESWGAMAEMVAEGLVRRVGMSEATVDELARAHRIHPVSTVQSEFSLWSRDALDDVIPWCAAHGADFLAYAPLGRGFLTGRYKSREQFAPGDRRLRLPRFSDRAMVRNGAIVERIRAVAARHDATPGQIALAWALAKGPHIIPLAGTRRLDHLTENAAAMGIRLGSADVEQLDLIPPPAEARY